MTTDTRSYLEAAATCEGQVAPLLEVLQHIDVGTIAPLPGSGAGGTAERYRLLSRAAAADVTAARVLEPHLDALAILAEAGLPQTGEGSTWGVFAAEAPDAVVVAQPRGSSWILTGVKPWCSLGGRLTDALVTAHTEAGQRRLFRVDLTQASVTAEETPWVSRGLADVASGPLRFENAEAMPVGEPGWYLSRPGFRWGAIGVAAAWWGGCLPLFDALLARATREAASPLVVARVGVIFRAIDGVRILLARAADVVDDMSQSDQVDEHGAAVLAHSVRGAAADGAVATLSAAQDILGPAVFGFDESLARRAADLQMYISQYHRGPDDVSLVSHLGETSIRW